MEHQTSISMKDVTIDPLYESMVPPLTDEEYNRLKDSISENGLYEKITINQDHVILDGHHRFRACKDVGVMPRFEVKIFDSKNDEMIYVIESNVIRRQLTDYNKTILAMKLEPMYAEKAKQRMLSTLTNVGNNVSLSSFELSDKGQARDQAAKTVGLSPTTYHRAKTIIEKGSDYDVQAFKEDRQRPYTIFKNMKIREEIAKLDKQIENIDQVEGVFDCIVVDPPWDMGNYDQASFAAAPIYPKMSIDEIKNIKLPCAENCVVWLWTTNTFLHEAYHVLKAWELEPKSVLTWVKEGLYVGVWLRGKTEHCILAVKGKPLWDLHSQSTALMAPNRGHSVKPDEFYDLVDSLCYGRKLDYFAREKREGWFSYGTLERSE